MNVKFEASIYLNLSVLRRAAPTITGGRKKPYINYLFTNERERLIALIEIEKARKPTHFFLFRLADSFNDISQFKKILGKKHEDEGFIYKVSKVIVGNNKVIIRVSGYTDKRKIRWCDQHTLQKKFVEGRKNFYLSMIVHFEDSILEIRTRSEDRAAEGAKVFGEFLVPESRATLIQNLKEKLHGKDPEAKPGRAVFDFAGSEINLQGDPNQTFEALREQGFNIQELGIDVQYDEAVSQNLPIRAFSNGRIVVTKKVDDVYELIKDLIP
jgi:hypothetical protein